MGYEFPVIKHISDVLPAIEGRWISFLGRSIDEHNSYEKHRFAGA